MSAMRGVIRRVIKAAARKNGEKFPVFMFKEYMEHRRVKRYEQARAEYLGVARQHLRRDRQHEAQFLRR